MLSKDCVQKICYDKLCSLNLGSGCDHVVSSIASGNTATAARELEKIVLHSIANCLHEVLKEYENSINRK